jgi:hypothetical protein
MAAIARRRRRTFAMKQHDRIARGATWLAALLLAAGLTACGERISDSRSEAPAQGRASPSAVVIGQAPAEPSGDPAGTTPVAPGTTEISKAEESRQKPQEGDNHSYSTTAPVTPQKAEGVNMTGDGNTGGKQ